MSFHLHLLFGPNWTAGGWFRAACCSSGSHRGTLSLHGTFSGPGSDVFSGGRGSIEPGRTSGEAVFRNRGLGRRPLSPVHLRGLRDQGSGDWAVAWTRRTRLGGDGWEQEEVPLGESAEAYRLQILDGPGGDVLRSVDVAAPAYAYPAGQQVTDFGSAQYAFWARVAQISPSFGPGIFHQQQVWVRRAP